MNGGPGDSRLGRGKGCRGGSWDLLARGLDVCCWIIIFWSRLCLVLDVVEEGGL